MSRPSRPLGPVLPVVLVGAAHAAALAGLWAAGGTPPLPAPEVVEVEVIPGLAAPVAAPPPVPVPAPPTPRPVERRVAPPAPTPLPTPVPPAPSPAPSAPAAVPAAAPPAPAAAPAEPADVIIPPRVDASYRGNPQPAYPLASRRQGEQGTVQLRLFVNADGSVGDILVARSSGYERLDRSALETVRRWKLVPARRGSEPVAAWYTLPIRFNLEN